MIRPGNTRDEIVFEVIVPGLVTKICVEKTFVLRIEEAGEITFLLDVEWMR